MTNKQANIKQLHSLENLKKSYCLLNVGEYGFYSNNSIGVSCNDYYGDFCALIDVNGVIISTNF